MIDVFTQVVKQYTGAQDRKRDIYRSTNPSWITSALHALEKVALMTPIANRNASRFDSILLFRKGPTKATTKIADKPPRTRVLLMISFYDIGLHKKQLPCRQLWSIESLRIAKSRGETLGVKKLA